MSKGWARDFDDPIPLPRGRQLVTLEDASQIYPEASEGGAATRGVAGRGRSDAPGCRSQLPDHDGAHRRHAGSESTRDEPGGGFIRVNLRPPWRTSPTK